MRLFPIVFAFLFTSSSLARAVGPADLDLPLGHIVIDVPDENDLPMDPSAAGQPSTSQAVPDLNSQFARESSPASFGSSSQPPQALISGGGVDVDDQPKTFAQLLAALENFPRDIPSLQEFHAIHLGELPQGAYLGHLFLLPQNRFKSIDVLLMTEFENKYGIKLDLPPEEKDMKRSDFFQGIWAYPLGDPIHANTITDYIYFTANVPPPLKSEGEPTRLFFWMFGKPDLYDSPKFSGLYLGDFYASASALHKLDLTGLKIGIYNNLSKRNPKRLDYQQPPIASSRLMAFASTILATIREKVEASVTYIAKQDDIEKGWGN